MGARLHVHLTEEPGNAVHCPRGSEGMKDAILGGGNHRVPLKTLCGLVQIPVERP